jgi:hypothetical protein
MAYGAPAIPTGNTGILKIIADRIILQDGGNISVKHEGIGNGGNIKLNAGLIIGINNRQIWTRESARNCLNLRHLLYRQRNSPQNPIPSVSGHSGSR